MKRFQVFFAVFFALSFLLASEAEPKAMTTNFTKEQPRTVNEI